MKNNHHYIYKFLLGLLFGLGLILSGMIYPTKVIGFLDIFGAWDYSLVFVMLGGVVTYATYFFLHNYFYPNHRYTLWGYEKNWPVNKVVDKKLVVGSVLFGVGWGLYGFCPGPAMVGLGMLNQSALVFTGFMIVGMYIYSFLEKLNINFNV